ncbi:MAG: serine hydrolase [Myxococcaceae bacterium]|nr:serine hydrolase [Myxococcaceae bacterium]
MLHGQHEPGFEALAQQLTEILSQAPYGGANLTVYEHGRPVFDMWGGPKNNEGDLWEEHTPAVSYSSGKPVVATCLHILRDRGLVQYDAPVAKYWPEFAQNGKSTITVRQALTHAAGLYEVRNIVEHADVLLDWDATVQALERAPAAHAPGRYHGYHAVTYGHLIGEIVRRVSGKPLSRFIQDELAEPLGLHDFFIGAPEDAIARAARIIRAPKKELSEEAKAKRRAVAKAKEQRFRKLARGLNLIGLPLDADRMHNSFSPRGVESWDFSSPQVLRACIPAANSLFTGRDLARFYAMLAAGGSLDGVRILSRETLREATQVHTSLPDRVLVAPMRWRMGFHAMFSKLGPVRGGFGHSGYNGSGGWASPLHSASFGYVVNAGFGTPFGDWRTVKLTSTALSCLKLRKKRAA